MNKIKPTIGLKILLLTSVLSIAMVLSSYFVTYKLFSDKTEVDMLAKCEASAETVQTPLASADYYSFVEEYKDLISDIYTQTRELLDDIDGNDDKEDIYKNYIANIKSCFFSNGLGFSYDMAQRKLNYNAIRQFLDMIVSSNDLDGGSVFFFDKEYANAVCLVDSSTTLENLNDFDIGVLDPGENDPNGYDQEESKQPETGNTLFPGNLIKDKNVIIESLSNGDEDFVYHKNGSYISVKPIKNPDTGETIAYVTFYRSDKNIQQGKNWFANTALFITLAATVVLMLFYLIFANRLIVKNIKKLTAVSENFTDSFESNNKIVEMPAGIKTRDEIGTLSEKFDVMQNKIVEYIGSLAEKTATEEKMKAELDLASKIQAEALPKDALTFVNVSISSFLRPAKEVGGDFYDYFPLDEKRVFFYISDVSGKGIPAAMFMMRAKELIKSNANLGIDLPSLAFKVNNALCAGNEEGLFITAFFGVFDSSSGVLKYLRAGQEQPFLKRGNVVKKIAEESNFILGSFENITFEASEIKLEKGDRLLLYTDGLNEGINKSEEEFGYDRIVSVLQNTETDILPALYNGLCEFASGADQFDDITMLLAEIGGAAEYRFDSPDYEDIVSLTNNVFEKLSDVGEESLSEIGIIIDEIMNNCISYAFEGSRKAELIVTLSYFHNRITLRFIDNGISFDPLKNKANDLSTDVLTRPEGGMGIAIVKSLAEEIKYERIDDRNVLTIRYNNEKDK